MRFVRTIILAAFLAAPFAAASAQDLTLVNFLAKDQCDTCTIGDGCTSCAPYGAYDPSNPMSSAQSSQTPLDFTSPFDGGLGSSTDVAVMPGYIETPAIMNLFRLRFDGLFDNDTPDRAEFFYAQCACNGFGAPGPGSVAGTTPPQVNGNVDAQIYSMYLESARSDRFSVFAELPFRAIQPEPLINGVLSSGDEFGVGDLNLGLKYALIQTPDSIFTFQMRVYTPTGNASEGLGTDHVSLEPGVMFQRYVTSNLLLFGEFKDWIPINGSAMRNPNSRYFGKHYAGDVLRYGLGTGYICRPTCNVTITPLVEVVGWSVLGGLTARSVDGGTGVDVVRANTTIVNAKAGVRMNILRGDYTAHTFYVGYGQALTGTTWYDHIIRAEWGLIF